MTPDQFEARSHEGASAVIAARLPPDAGHDAVILAAARGAGDHIRMTRATRRRRYLRAAGVAAMSIIGIALWDTTGRPPTDEVAEATAAPPTLASAINRPRIAAGATNEPRIAADGSVPADGATVLRKPRRLAWSDRDGVGPYRVSLHSMDGGMSWISSPVTTSHLALPADLQLAPGATYLWAVEPQRAGARTLGPYMFRMPPETAP